MVLKTLLRSAAGWLRSDSGISPNVPDPLEEEARLDYAHTAAGVDHHLSVLIGNATVAGRGFIELYTECLRGTGTMMPPAQAFRRYLGRYYLAKYFEACRRIPGGRLECGVYRGATSLLLCRVAALLDPAFRGDGYFLVDSFSGTRQSATQDLISLRRDDGTTEQQSFFQPGRTDASFDEVRRVFTAYPGARVLKGWVPEVLGTLPEQPWAFVHLDVTLYEPTLAALEYFHPRLSPGAVIVMDGYGSSFCPGLARAWDEFCDRRALGYVILPTRQAVLTGASS